MHKSFEVKKRNENIGGDKVASVEEAEMSSSTDYANENDDLVSEFDVSTCLGDNIYEIFENKGKIIAEDLNV